MTRSLLLFDAGFEPTCSFTIVGMSSPPLSGVTLRTLLMRPRYVNQLNVFRPSDFSIGSARRTQEIMLVPNQREPAISQACRIILPSIAADRCLPELFRLVSRNEALGAHLPPPTQASIKRAPKFCESYYQN
jgi:hypothetical protein